MMRTAFRTLLVRSFSRIRSTTSRIESLAPQVRPPLPPILASLNPTFRHLSSEPAAAAVDYDHALLAQILSTPSRPGEMKSSLTAANLPLDDDDAVNSALRSLERNPDAARLFFDWLSERENTKLRSKSYNIMLEILGANRRSDEFWGMVDTMKNVGYGVSKGTFLKVSEIFNSSGMKKDFDRLKEMYFLNSHENVVSRICPVICKILRGEEDNDVIQNKLQDMTLNLSSDLVVEVLERIGQYPKKATVFFKWVEGNRSFKIDGKVYNAMAKAMGREDCIEEFWDVLHKMRSDGYELEREVFLKVSGRFHTRRMVTKAVDLYEFAMDGSVKPSVEDFMFLLKKATSSKTLDVNLISKVVSIYVRAGNSVKGSAFDAVVKSLRSVGGLGECDKVLKAMERGGFVADSATYDRVVIGLCDAGKLKEACEYVEGLENSGSSLDLKVWTSLVQKHALAGDLDSAVSCFRKMVDRKGGENVGSAFEVLVNQLCQANRVENAFKILKELVTKKNIKPWHSTYKFLIEKLLCQGRIKEASTLLGSMKSHGFPPFIDPFIGYIAKSGSTDDVTGFLKAMSTKEFPSLNVFVRIFEALLKAGRHDVAHNVLSISPGSVRNHVDVLNLFHSMKLDETDVAAAI